MVETDVSLTFSIGWPGKMCSENENADFSITALCVIDGQMGGPVQHDMDPILAWFS